MSDVSLRIRQKAFSRHFSALSLPDGEDIYLRFSLVHFKKVRESD